MAETVQEPTEQPRPKSVAASSGDDVATEPYRGPGAIVAGAGEASISHFALGFIGLAVGFIAAFIFHKPVAAFIERRREIAHTLMDQTNGESTWGKFLLSTFGHGKGTYTGAVKSLDKPWRTEIGSEELAKLERGWLYNVSNSIREWPIIKQIMGLFGQTEEALARVNTAIMGGGLGTAVGFFILPFAFWFTGAQHAHRGRKQFERAQEEIKDTRAKYATAQAELELLKSGKQSEAPQAPENPLPESPGTQADEHTKKRDDEKPPALAARKDQPEERTKKREDQKPEGLVHAVSRESVLSAAPTNAVSAS